MATSMLEGGGRTPWMDPKDLEALGYSMVRAERHFARESVASVRKPSTVVGQRDVCRARMQPAKAPHRLAVLIANTCTSISLAGQSLSASVDSTLAEAASWPHLHPAISGMSSPYRQLYSL